MQPKSQTLVVGSDAVIGRRLVESLEEDGRRVTGTTRRRDAVSKVRSYLELREDPARWLPPDVSVAFLCAAVTSCETCRADPLGSALVNVERTVEPAGRLARGGSHVVFLSTNLVFDGRIPHTPADAKTNPLTQYGRQKAEVERQLQAIGSRASIVRFSKVVPPEFPLFDRWLAHLKAGTTIRPFSDRFIAPVPLDFAVSVLRRVADSLLSGTVQASGGRDVSYADVGQHLARRLGARADLVEPIRAVEAGIAGAAAAHTTLDMTRLRKELKLEPPDVWDTIDAVCRLN